MTPEVILGAFGLIGTALGIPGITLWLLNRKDANKKLSIEADALTMTKFNSLLAGYEKRMDRYEQELAEKGRTEEQQNKAIKDLQERDRQKQHDLDITNGRLERVREVFLAYVRRVGIPLTTDESQVFEETAPLSQRAHKSRSYRPNSPETPAT